eukprot:CAMPEP_0181169844 /NCGR_PEP_ID=MMETSP1096-20121128/1035_1 /TAXON_ID=156174 ORGANISM="Chrysochromulina ericina, Strain CCMP281" /NCGR_SAMPLE_ID=MMETSP1096 /ASSEMBLY_ACC=CAM_ASM_000453 /LENGTH=39 /DNA_ID= /DNA_START= /DNA_END= /DNA_ORIENTATION=
MVPKGAELLWARRAQRGLGCTSDFAGPTHPDHRSSMAQF